MSGAPFKFFLFLGAGILSLSACVDPYAPPCLDTDTLGATYRHALKSAGSQDHRTPFWHTLGDPALGDLVDSALEDNLDIKIALDRVAQAQAAEDILVSPLFPNLTAVGNQVNNRTDLSEALKRAAPDTKTGRLGFQVNWELDIFGSRRQALEGAHRDSLAAAYATHATRLLVASEICRLYGQLVGAKRQLTLVRQLIQSAKETENYAKYKERSARVTQFDVWRAQADRQNLEAQAADIEKILGGLESNLSVLAGTSPTMPPEAILRAGQKALTPRALTPGLPLDLLRQRPDVLAAEQRLAADVARTEEARSNLFPKFSLSALFGTQAIEANGVSWGNSRFSSLSGAFSLPIFDTGRLYNVIKFQDAKAQQTAHEYEKTILTALGEVETALANLQGERRRLKDLRQVLHNRDQAYRYAKTLYRSGRLELDKVLEAQKGLVAANLDLVQSETNLVIQTVQLHKAMGSGCL